MIRIVEYLDIKGNSPFAKWFEGLDSQVALKVNTYVTRLEGGNFSNVKSVGAGVSEVKIDWGPGYRVYVAKDGEKLVILLGGGTKKRQQKDIEQAKLCWQDYKMRKREK
jgi:putative addiction module killer protein